MFLSVTDWTPLGKRVNLAVFYILTTFFAPQGPYCLFTCSQQAWVRISLDSETKGKHRLHIWRQYSALCHPLKWIYSAFLLCRVPPSSVLWSRPQAASTLASAEMWKNCRKKTEPEDDRQAWRSGLPWGVCPSTSCIFSSCILHTNF